MGRFINTNDLHIVVEKRKSEYGCLAWLVDNIVKEMVYETPTEDVVGRKKYDLLQQGYETLKHQLEESWNRIDELDKLNGNMRSKIDKAIKEMESIPLYAAYTRGDIRQMCIDILKRNIGEQIIDLIDKTKYRKELLSAYDDVSMELGVLDNQPPVNAIVIPEGATNGDMVDEIFGKSDK